MMPAFTILGRGRLGRALAAAFELPLLPHTARPAGFVLLAVPDHAIAELALAFEGRAFHASGSLHVPGLPCLHPLTSFDGQPRDWQNTPLAQTGALPEAVLKPFDQAGFARFQLEPSQKARYHAAAVLCSGHAASLWLGAEALLKDAGISLPGDGLWPLARATLANVALHGAAGQTGPFVRNDEATIARDADALPEAWREVFLKLGSLAFKAH